VITLAIGIWIGSVAFDPTGPLLTGENTYQAGWDAAKKRLADSGYAVPAAIEVLHMGGEVIEVRSNEVVLKIRPLEPLADPELDMRIVKIDANTIIYRAVQKDPIAYQKEVQEYNKKIQQSIGGPAAGAIIPPQMFLQEKILVSGIQKGDQILVGATQNVKEAKEFVAATITVQTLPAIAPPAPVQ